jgi:hypothetical protein
MFSKQIRWFRRLEKTQEIVCKKCTYHTLEDLLLTIFQLLFNLGGAGSSVSYQTVAGAIVRLF